MPDGHHIIGQFKEHKPWETTEYDKNGVIVGKIVNGVKTIENSRQVTPELEVDAPINFFHIFLSVIWTLQATL